MWDLYEDSVEKQNSWFKSMESYFQDKQLFSTLEEKQNYMTKLKAKRDNVVKREKDIDTFVDKALTLVQTSGVDRLKPYISSVSTRYQSLHILSKDVLNKWETLVDEHKSYTDKLEETNIWLTDMEAHLAGILSETQPDLRVAKLSELSSEKESRSQNINDLTEIGEKLYPATAAQGRDKIRTELRGIRDR